MSDDLKIQQMGLPVDGAVMADTWESAGEPEPLPAGGTVAAANPYVSLEDDGPPQPLRQMSTPQGEADYQQWVNQHTSTKDPTQFQTPSMGSRSVTVDPYGNGVGVDLRAMYQNHAAQPFEGFDKNPLNPPSGPKTLDPSPDLLNQYALPSSGQLTKDSIYAHGQPDSNLGSWGEDENGNPQYNQPGWEPLTTTQKIMGAAKRAAIKAASNVTVDNALDAANPVNALSNVADEGAAALKGLGGSFHTLGETANIVGGAAPVLYDKAASLFTGKDTTAAQDAWFKNTVDPLTDQDDAFELAQNAGLDEKAAHMFGSSLGFVAQMVLTGGEAAPLEAGATGATAIKAAIEHGVPAAALPATTDAIDTGRKVYAETGDGVQAVKAAQVQYLVSTVGSFAPLHVPGGSLAARAAQGAGAGLVTGEAGREAMNTVLPENMQTPFTGQGAALEALGGATIAGVGGRRPTVPDAEFAADEGKNAAPGKPFDADDVSPPPPPPRGNGGLGEPPRDYSDPADVFADYTRAAAEARGARARAAQAPTSKNPDGVEAEAAVPGDPQAATDQINRFHASADAAEQAGNGKAALNMVNPVFDVADEQFTGEDWQGHLYANPDEGTWKRTEDHLIHLAQGFGPMAFSGSNKFEGANDQGLGGLLWRLAPIFGVTSAPAYITKPDQMEREQKLRDETDWQKAQSQRLKAARKAGDAATVDKLREQMRADAKIKGANERAEAQERSQKRAAAHSDKTSQLLDHVGSLVDQGGTRAQIE